MIKIDLITGFLGSGKTTFIHEYARYLIGKGLNIGILENDYGAINVDMMLLDDLPQDKCELEMVIGGDYDCHRRRFKTKLISMAMSGYDRVLVEPSGIYDVDEFFDVLYEEPLDRFYEKGNVISVFDAHLPDDLSDESDYLLAAQAANAGLIVISRAQEADEAEIDGVIAHINRALEKYKCSRRIETRLAKDWSCLTPEDFSLIENCGCVSADHVRLQVDHENAYSSLFYMNVSMNAEELQRTAEELFATPAYGTVIRVKGFVPQTGDEWLEINATKNKITVEHARRGQAVLIVIGEKLSKDKIDKLFSPYLKIS